MSSLFSRSQTETSSLVVATNHKSISHLHSLSRSFASLYDSMSSLIFVGVFSLRDGRRSHLAVTKKTGEQSTTWHTHYTSALICREPPELPVELRVFTRNSDNIYADHTVALVIAKGFIPAPDVPGDLLLDAIHVAPFPGNPAGENYDATLPTFMCPLIFGIGNVCGSSTQLPEHKVAFPISLSEYVRGSTRPSTITYFYLSFALRCSLTRYQLHYEQGHPTLGQCTCSQLGFLYLFRGDVFPRHHFRCLIRSH
jgi:hypothetical protein